MCTFDTYSNTLTKKEMKDQAEFNSLTKSQLEHQYANMNATRYALKTIYGADEAVLNMLTENLMKIQSRIEDLS